MGRNGSVPEGCSGLAVCAFGKVERLRTGSIGVAASAIAETRGNITSFNGANDGRNALLQLGVIRGFRPSGGNAPAPRDDK